MVDVQYKDARIQIQPYQVPGGWRVKVHVWQCQKSVTVLQSLPPPEQFAFTTAQAAQTYGERVGLGWVDCHRAPAQH